jgi:hypothetical protein
MKPRRCPVCGGFYEGDDCPNTPNHPIIPPTYDIGSLVRFPWPTSGDPTVGIIVTEADEDGMVGVHYLNPNVRVPLDDVEEIT